LLILDEPTSSLDSESQRDVLETLSTLMGDCTMIIVTHSEAVSALCDRVIKLDSASSDSAGCEIGRSRL